MQVVAANSWTCSYTSFVDHLHKVLPGFGIGLVESVVGIESTDCSPPYADSEYPIWIIASLVSFFFSGIIRSLLTSSITLSNSQLKRWRWRSFLGLVNICTTFFIRSSCGWLTLMLINLTMEGWRCTHMMIVRSYYYVGILLFMIANIQERHVALLITFSSKYSNCTDMVTFSYWITCTSNHYSTAPPLHHICRAVLTNTRRY